MSRTWTSAELGELEVSKGFRLRGTEMSRLETFTDAAFAFAVTLLVISTDEVPNTYEELVTALESVPAFVMCFMQLMLFWWGHHVWSRRYGLEGGWDIVLSLALVASVLIYVYPLRVIFTAFLWNVTEGTLSTSFELTIQEVGTMYLVFGIFFSLLSAILTMHFVRAYALRDLLALNEREKVETRGDILSWSLVSLTGILSVLVSVALPVELKPAAGYVFWSLAVSMPLSAWYTQRKRRALLEPEE